MPVSNSTSLSERDLQMISVLLLDAKKKHKDLTTSMDWDAYTGALGLKGSKEAKTAFELTWCKVRNIANTVGSGGGQVSSGSGTLAPAAPKKKKATTASAGSRKRKAPASSAKADDDDDDSDVDHMAVQKRARRANAPEPVQAEDEPAMIKEEEGIFGWDGKFDEI
ncbi:uncharacterized protein PG998_004995 [Apiospora kogelbergensis]|uniref:uncharacterized protein n=1 Tax=Apiospora kogelbergensis TaxID=1337665 RepID=UPI00312D3981